MEEDAGARKERLKSLRKAAADQGLVQGQDASKTAAVADPGDSKPVLKFRNYNIKDHKHIEHEKVRGVVLAAAAASSPSELC